MRIEKNLQLIGYDNTFNKLIILYKKKLFPKKIILTGRNGTGKTTFAYHLINFILSENENFPYELLSKKINSSNKSYKLIQNNTHPNFFKISVKDEKKNIEISQTRDMINFINKSSFYNKQKIVLIENTELLNINAANTLLKSVEEPNEDLFFILLLNNEKKTLDTIKSRCVEYKLNLNNAFVSEIVDCYFNDEIYKDISPEFKNYYNTPSIYIKFVKFCEDNDLDYKNISLNELIKYLLKNNFYNRNSFIYNDLKFYIELFFRNKVNNFKKKELFDLYNYFNKRFMLINKFNLDQESYYMEFKSKLLNE